MGDDDGAGRHGVEAEKGDGSLLRHKAVEPHDDIRGLETSPETSLHRSLKAQHISMM